MAGRKPLGPKLVHHLDGSAHAKQRMEVILETIAGKLTVEEGCNKLGIEQAMFFRLRTQALQAGLDRLEPRPAGRPPNSSSPQCQRIAELEQELAEKDVEMKATEVRLEIAGAIPQLLQGADLKKTKARRPAKSKRQRRRGKKAR
jgi:hypothetical protein